MPLSQKELQEIEASITKKLTVAALLVILKTKYLVKDPMVGAMDKPSRNENVVHKIHPNRRSPQDATRKREINSGFKVRTAEESQRQDKL